MSTNGGIKTWSNLDKPREKLLSKGKKALSDSELLAILIRSGTKDKSAVELSRDVLKDIDFDLRKLAKLEPSDLMTYKGIGEAKAITIVAAIELGRRKSSLFPLQQIEIRSSIDAYRSISSELEDLNHEEFWVIFLNRGNKMIAKDKISQGGIESTIVDVRILMRKALNYHSTGIILAHNHPSGNLHPSDEDILLTQRINKACNILNIQLHDHIIVAQGKYFSFKEQNQLG